MNYFTRVKSVCQVFIKAYVTKLVGNDFCVADDCVDVGVGVAVYPGINAAIGNVIA